MNNHIKEIAKNAMLPLQIVSINGAKKIKEFHFSCAELEDFNNIDITKSEKYSDVFDEMKDMTGPCAYFFELETDHLSADIIASIRKYSESENSKSIPAIKKTIPESKILYVGKVKRHFFGRFIQHLGFYKVNRTQGLQLFYWAKELGIELKLTILEFEPEMINLMEVIENDLAKQLKPILGKHK
jgi:hypothetical protein